LDVEWQKYNIRVLDVMPLFVQTDMVKNMDAGSIQNIGVDLTPADVAKQVLHLAQQKTHHCSNTYSYRN
jgi:NAD(P)-dependent dehydrogenase (short-subunit alcohol dehydrogenase family)